LRRRNRENAATALDGVRESL